MNIEEFEEELNELGFGKGIVVGIYYYSNEKGEIVLDLEGMEKEFQNKIGEIDDIIK